MKFRITIKTKDIWMFMLILPLIAPEGLYVISPALYKILYGYFRYASLGMIFTMFAVIHVNKKKKMSIFLILFLVLVAVNVSITWFHHAATYACVAVYINAIAIIMLSDICENDLFELLDVIYVYLVILLTLNMICIMVYPNGMYKLLSAEGYQDNWLLGYKSSLQYYILPAYCMAAIRVKYKERKWFEYFAFLLIHVEAFQVQNKMLIIGILILDILLIFKLCQYSKILNSLTYCLGAIVLNYLLLSMQILNSKVFMFIANEILHKNLLTSRGRVWKITAAWIRKSWIWGYGRVDSEVRYLMYGNVAHSHNQILEFLFQGGIILLSCYLFINIYIVRKLYKNRDIYLAQVLSACILALYIMTSVEIFTRALGATIWLIFALASKVDSLQIMYDERK